MMRLLALILFCVAAPAAAWDGYDYQKGTFIEIERGNLVRPGRTIEYFDYDDLEYKLGEVLDIDRTGSSVGLEVLDPETGDIRLFDMDD